MKVLTAKLAIIIANRFNHNIYNIGSPYFITSDLYWDGGINNSCSLQEKSEFYSLANIMSNILKEILICFNEDFYIAEFLCENHKMYEKWSDRKNFEIFKKISKIFKTKKFYQLTLLDDSNLIDLVVESNFKYFSNISLFLPNVNIVIQPTCHTEIIIYSQGEKEKIFSNLNKIVSKYPEVQIKIY